MRAIDAGILVCGECHQLNRADGNEHPRCSRCGAKLHPRRPNSIARTWALLISAMILYVPANLLPIMTVNMLGKGSPATIMGGVVTLIQADMFPIALVVFVASIVVPTFKLVGIALLLYSVQRHQPMSARQRIMMYRFIEWVGRWSMLDIFVIAILVALVNFGNLASIEANLGAAAFASVVVLTMLAAVTFDPGLSGTTPIWTTRMSDLPSPKKHKTSNWSAIWVLPLVALAIGAWLGWRAYDQAGVLIQVRFESSDGIQAKKTEVLYKGIAVGKVVALDVSEDIKGVVATIEMDKEARQYLSKGTRFWLVKPRVSLAGVTGLETLVSGVYIAVDPVKGEKEERNFTALKQPPPFPTGCPACT